MSTILLILMTIGISLILLVLMWGQFKSPEPLRSPDRIYFQNPVFNDQYGTTVRLGTKWRYTEIDTHKEVCQTGSDTVIGYMHILGVLAVTLGTIPSEYIEINHDPSCRTRKGLLREMKRVYGSHVDQSDIVTVLYYKLLKVSDDA